MRFYLEQICSALISVTLLSAPVSAVAGPGGTGGGDPADVQRQVDAINPNSGRQFPGSHDGWSLSELEILEANLSLSNVSSEIRVYWTLLNAIDYPFSQAFRKNVDLERTIESLDRASNPLDSQNPKLFARFSVNNDLKLNGQPITFLSNPTAGTLVMNARRYEWQAKVLKPWALAGTVFHEGLRLQNIEDSRSYPYSGEFSAALKNAFEDSNFWSSVMASDFVQKCSGMNSHAYMALHIEITLSRKVPNSFLSEAGFQNLDQAIQRCF